MRGKRSWCSARPSCPEGAEVAAAAFGSTAEGSASEHHGAPCQAREGSSELPLDDDGPCDGGALPPAAMVPNVADWTLRKTHQIVEEEEDEGENVEEGK